MSYLLTSPTTIVVLDGDSGVVDDIRDAVVGGQATEVIAAPSLEAMVTEIDERDDVGCVIVGGDLPDATTVAACRTIQETADLLPVIAHVADGSERLAHKIVHAGAFDYVPRPVADTVLRESVDEAISTYRTRREQAEESDMFTTMLERIGFPIYVKDREARHLRLSNVPGGLKPESARGKTDVELFDDRAEEARETYQDDLDVIENGREIYERVERFDDITEDYWSKTTKVPWYGDDGQVKGLIGVSLNVTDYMKCQQRLEEHGERIDQFTNYVSHDLRNPLQAASGAVELAKETGNCATLQQASDALDRIDEMIDDLTAIAKEEGEMGSLDGDVADSEPTFEQTTFAALAADVWNVVGTDEATLDLDVPAATQINVPETSMRPLFENVFKNAIVHAGPDVRIRAGLLNDGFFLEDDGPGIPEADRERVLEEGYTTGEEGSGMGLSIVSDTVGQHDWDLTICDSVAGGARFEVRNCLVVPDPPDRTELGEELRLENGRQTDIGPTQVTGEAEYDEETDRWTVRGGGTNIWRQENEFFFVHTTVDGPVRMQGRIESIENFSEYSKAAFMIRDDVAEDASYGAIGMTPRHGTEILWRHASGEDGVSQHLEEETATFPWYRIDRVDDCITTSLSSDGGDWYVADQRSVEFDESVEVGLVVCSYVPQRLCEANFEDVTIRRIENA